MKLVMLSRYDASDKNCSQGITELRELKQKFIQRKLMFPEILYVAVFLMMLKAESVVRDKITLIVNEKYLEITLEEVIQTYTSYARDLELSKETQIALSGKRSKAGKTKVKNEEFDKCKQYGNCFKCAKDGLEVKYIECTKHNKNLSTVSIKTVSISRNNRYNDYLNARLATTHMSEEDKYEEAIWHKENLENENDVKVYKIGSVILVDSGAAFTSVNESIQLQNRKNIRGTRLEYADGSVGTEIKTKGNVVLNGHKVPAFYPPNR